MPQKQANKTNLNNWKISLSPHPVQQLILIAIVWLFSGATLYLLSFTEGGVTPFWYVIVLPFPLIISLYALRGIIGNNGTLELQADGFSWVTPHGKKRFINWKQLEAFGIGIFGDPVVTETGVAVPEFAYRDDTGNRKVERLPTNLPVSAEKLVMIMNYAHGEAQKGWPSPPESYKNLSESATLDIQKPR